MSDEQSLYRNKHLKDLVIGIIGGTGAQGTGLAYRLAQAGFSVVIGSRDSAKARSSAESLGDGITGTDNFSCATQADLVIIAVPWDSHKETITSIKSELSAKIVIDCVNPLGFDQGGAFSLPVPEGSALGQAQAILEQSQLVGAFHHVSAVLLADRSLDVMDIDVLVVGNEKSATDLVQTLVNEIKGMRGIYAGKTRNAAQIEAFTANLISMNRRYKTHAGVRITGVN
ncbi:MAG: NADPH-dependent F420 reductase [Actinobacteria bacterium]|nr:MAG: NADPH-dependent F420 reductase [Actinomycetota bacterium]